MWRAVVAVLSATFFSLSLVPLRRQSKQIDDRPTMVLWGGLQPIPSQLLLDVASLAGLAASAWMLTMRGPRTKNDTAS